jgi:hypothetical protein
MRYKTGALPFPKPSAPVFFFAIIWKFRIENVELKIENRVNGASFSVIRKAIRRMAIGIGAGN